MKKSEFGRAWEEKTRQKRARAGPYGGKWDCKGIPSLQGLSYLLRIPRCWYPGEQISLQQVANSQHPGACLGTLLITIFLPSNILVSFLKSKKKYFCRYLYWNIVSQTRKERLLPTSLDSGIPCSSHMVVFNKHFFYTLSSLSIWVSQTLKELRALKTRTSHSHTQVSWPSVWALHTCRVN